MKKEVQKIIDGAKEEVTQIVAQQEQYTYEEVITVATKAYLKGRLVSQGAIDALVDFIETEDMEQIDAHLEQVENAI